MDWTLAIDRNRAALLHMLAAVCAMVGIGPEQSVSVLSRRVRSLVFLVLRPAESAVRRLVIVVAMDLVVPEFVPRCAPIKSVRRGVTARGVSFALLDPLKRFGAAPRPRPAGPGPRLSYFDGFDPVVAVPMPVSPDDLIESSRLCQRVLAVQAALKDLTKQAKRLARWRMRRQAAVKRVGRVSPMRPGWPPGHRTRHRHEVDGILADCHALAVYALRPPDTS